MAAGDAAGEGSSAACSRGGDCEIPVSDNPFRYVAVGSIESCRPRRALRKVLVTMVLALLAWVPIILGFLWMRGVL